MPDGVADAVGAADALGVAETGVFVVVDVIRDAVGVELRAGSVASGVAEGVGDTEGDGDGDATPLIGVVVSIAVGDDVLVRDAVGFDVVAVAIVAVAVAADDCAVVALGAVVPGVAAAAWAIEPKPSATPARRRPTE